MYNNTLHTLLDSIVAIVEIMNSVFFCHKFHPVSFRLPRSSQNLGINNADL